MTHNPSFAKFCAGTALSALFLFFAAASVFAGTPEKTWRQINENTLSNRASRAVTPKKYLVFRLDQDNLQNSLNRLPLENTDAEAVEMEIPFPDGSLQTFKMTQTQVLSPELAAQFPTWKTFVGRGVDDPNAFGRFDWNAQGFHGYVETGRGIVFIDPYEIGKKDDYLVFYKHEYGTDTNEFYCSSDSAKGKSRPEFLRDFGMPELPIRDFSFGANVRTYKLAIATTGEWSRNAAGAGATTPQQIRTGALAVIVTSVNRLNGIFERELASRFQLVNPPIADDATNIIFDNPANDPYNNTSQNAQLTINHTTITNRVGTANFDIGHLFGTGGGGVANSPSICRNNSKGEGYSARENITGDPFVVDYVAHEIGHQFGADHTYNNLDTVPMMGVCNTRAPEEAFEVASGSTIMSYVGICANGRNLQEFNDTVLPAFHISSMTRINAYLTNPNEAPTQTGCGVAAGTNAIPTINGGASFTIPRLTPFTLTATGADADAGDVANLRYSWEEYDLGAQPSGAGGTPSGVYDVDTDNILRPLLRAYSPKANNSRTFPSLNFILNPATNEPAGSNQPQLTYTGTHPTGESGAVCETGETCVVGERLPTISRTMNFRVSVRDLRGGVTDAGTQVVIAGGAGPFQITSQNTTATIAGNSSQTVNWDVANSNAAPVSAANVNILLSTDGGLTFPTTLLANTPNDGSESVTIPNTATTMARIKIQAAANVFFDINNANLTITATTVVAPTNSRADFDGDGRTDLSVFRNGNWFIQRSTAGFAGVNWGTTGDVLLPGDFDGDNKTDYAVYRQAGPGPVTDLYVLNSNGNTVSGAAWGTTGDIPKVGDFTGDNRDDLAVYRPSNATFFILPTGGGAPSSRVITGAPANGTPIVITYDADAIADLGIRSGSDWYISQSASAGAVQYINWGIASDIPVHADYNNDNREDVAVFRNGTWFVLPSGGGAPITFSFGLAGDIAVPGDYDGDGDDEPAVFRNGTWFVNTTGTSFNSTQFGLTGDEAVPNKYVQ